MEVAKWGRSLDKRALALGGCGGWSRFRHRGSLQESETWQGKKEMVDIHIRVGGAEFDFILIDSFEVKDHGIY